MTVAGVTISLQGKQDERERDLICSLLYLMEPRERMGKIKAVFDQHLSRNPVKSGLENKQDGRKMGVGTRL